MKQESKKVNKFIEQMFEFINPKKNDDLNTAFEQQLNTLPTLWMLGKTGAGKSSIVQHITGNSDVEVGKGFKPCTQTADSYDCPANTPIIRFLDTRGLAEVNYDPSDDIASCKDRSHAIMVVMKAEECEQSSLISALNAIKKIDSKQQLLLVHTAINNIFDSAERAKAIAFNQRQIEAVWGVSLASVQVDFSLDADANIGLAELKLALIELLPTLTNYLYEQAHNSKEEQNFLKLKTEILWYAGVAGGAGAIPGVGIVSVPALQGKMLHSLAKQYGVEWNRTEFLEFIGAMGSGFALQYASALGTRELAKFIPVYGQTVGSATAAALSFATTYGIARAACMYLYHKSKGEAVDHDELKAVFQKALNITP
jgi:uncharacterized protein (DUF697 family)/predicted GTPase